MSSSPIEQVELINAMPPELAEKGWRIFLRDSASPYIAENDELDLSTGSYPTKNEVIDKAREMTIEEEEAAAIASDGAPPAPVAQQQSPQSKHSLEINLGYARAHEGRGVKHPDSWATTNFGSGKYDPLIDLWLSESEQGTAKEQKEEFKVESGRQDLPLNLIRIDGGTQPRSALDMLVVGDYKDSMLAGAEFPPIDVFFDGKDFWLADGFHRLQARKEAAVDSDPSDPRFDVITADVEPGSKRDALLYALGANATHGLPRSREDKRRAVVMMLEDEEWSRFSDNTIAIKVNVSQPFVSKLRRELTTQNVIRHQPTRIGADGVARDTTNIGKPADDDERQVSLGALEGVVIPPRAPEADAEETLAADAEAPANQATEDVVVDERQTSIDQIDGVEIPEREAAEDDTEDADEARNTAWTSEGIVELLTRHGGVLMRMQLEEMGVSYAAIHSAIADGVIIQPETGKFTLPDHKPQPSGESKRESTGASPAQKPKPTVEELLNGKRLSVSFTWIPSVKGKVSVSANMGMKPTEATRGVIDSSEVPRFPEKVLALVSAQIEKYAVHVGRGGARVAEGRVRVKKKTTAAKPAVKKSAKKAGKKAAKKSAVRRRK